MLNKGIGSSSSAKGLFVGSVVGAAVAFLNVPGRGKGFRSDIALRRERFQRRHQPLAEPRVEKNIETEKPARQSIGWLVAFYFASAVAMISDLRLKKI